MNHDKKQVIEFYGENCPFCKKMEPIVERLNEEGEVEIEQLEVWNNSENDNRMRAISELYKKHCGGNMIVPSFYDEQSNRLICNPDSYETLKEWLLLSVNHSKKP